MNTSLCLGEKNENFSEHSIFDLQMEKAGKAGYGKSGDAERRYVQLAPDSVSVAGESIGLSNIPAPVCRVSSLTIG